MTTNWVKAQAVVPSAVSSAPQSATITAPVVGSLLTVTTIMQAATTAPTSFTVSDSSSGTWTPMGAIQTSGLFSVQAFYKISDGTETSVTTVGVGFTGAAGTHRMQVDNYTVTGGGAIAIDLTKAAVVTATSFSVSPASGSSQPSNTDELAVIYYGLLGSTSGGATSASFTGTSALAAAALASTTTDTAFACWFVGGVQASATAGTNLFKAAWVTSTALGYNCATFYYEIPDTHCLPSGTLGTDEIPVCNISAAFNATQDPGPGSRRGVIIMITGLGNAYVPIPNPIPNTGTPGFYSRYGDFANAVQADGWIFIQPPTHELFCTNNVGYGSTAIYNDIANDSGFGARFTASTLHWWDHVVQFIHTTYGNVPIAVFGSSLGGLKTLIVAANRFVLGYMAHIPATALENLASAFAAPNNFGLLNCSGLSLNATYMNAVTVPGIVGYGTNDEAVAWSATTVAAGSAGVNVNTFTGTQSLTVASTTNIVASGPNVLLTGLTGGTGRATLSFTGVSGNNLTNCTLLGGSGTTVSGAPCVQNYADQIITNALGASQPVTRYATPDTHEFTGTPTAASGTASSGTLSTSSSTLTMTGSTASFPTSGTIILTHSSVQHYVAYTGTSGSTFTGCTIPSGSFTVTSGDAVIGGSDAAIYAAWVATNLDPLAPPNTF